NHMSEFTQTQLDALTAAISQGVTRVEYDGKTVTYGSVTERGLDLICRFEGFSPTIYACPAGWSTIGYGHVVRDHERQRFTAGIDEELGKELLKRDVVVAERAVMRLIRVPLSDGRLDALVRRGRARLGLLAQYRSRNFP
ncbi:MAG: lysozyme, partial [Alphaproteobacteria bacterium]|nr:lysozyme [Alphaproteobacteria bacterium]